MTADNEDYRVVAAITAAIQEYEGKSDFIIKSVARVEDNRWQKAGRESILRGKELIYLRRRRPL